MNRTQLLSKRFILLAVAIVLVVLVFIMYLLGFRPGLGHFGLTRVGTLVVQGVPDGATVFTDESKRGLTKGGILRAQLLPGNHSVIVSVKGDVPWNELVDISSGQNTIVHPILVGAPVTATRLNGSVESDAYKVVTNTKLPDEAHPLLMGGCTAVSVSENRVIAEATTTPGCTPPAFLCLQGSCAPTVVFAPLKPLTSVVAYPHRTDAVLVTFGDTVYAIELDPRYPQFFSPVLNGTNPRLGTLTDGTDVVAVGSGITVYAIPL